jgi:hypothetical protein
MQKPPDIPRTAGIFALFHKATNEAYVNTTNNLYQRAIMWAAHLRHYFEDNGALPPVRYLPRYAPDEWEFWFTTATTATTTAPGQTLENVRDLLAKGGWRIINPLKQPRKKYLIDGKSQSLAKHAADRGMKFYTVYKRLERGMSVEQALGLEQAPPVMDKRDIAIAMMAVQIESENGGLLTYDEALMMRPELGDIRKKITRLRHKNPDLRNIKLAEIPA